MVGAAAWAAPAVAMTVASPASAASGPIPTIAFLTVPGPVFSGQRFGDLVVSATTDGVTPVPAGTMITIVLHPQGILHPDGSVMRDYPATGTLESVTISGITAAAGLPFAAFPITALYAGRSADAFLETLGAAPAPTVAFVTVPPSVKAGESFADVAIAATTDGTTPAPVNSEIRVELGGSVTFSDGSQSKTFPASGAATSVTISGIRSAMNSPAMSAPIVAHFSTATAHAMLEVSAPAAGNVYAWGYNYSGEAGDTTAPALVKTPFRWPIGQKFTSITGAHGTFHAITTAGTIYASGYNDYGVLANGNTTSSAKKGPQGPAIKLTGETFLASRFAQANSCLDSTIFAFDADGVAHGVGNNPGGNFSIQDGSTKSTQHANKGYRPVGLEILKANPGKSIVAISDAGWWRALYLLDDGTVWNSGSNRYYAMGNKGTLDTMYLAAQTVKQDGSPLTDIVEAHAMQESSVYLDRSGQLWGAGHNQCGELPGFGDKGTKRPYAARLTNPGGKKVVKIWVNASDLQSVFAKTEDGVIYMAGNNTRGYGGIGTSDPSVNVWSKVIVPNGRTIAHIEFGGEGGLYLMTDGSVYFAGWNNTGGAGLGVSNSTEYSTMVQVPVPGRAIDIAGTYMDSYAVIVAE
jgi:alpha-tubulin suppressor-like RCC1 family protein